MAGKWSEDRTIHFVNEYITHDCLWNIKSPTYKIKNSREAAYAKIKEAMNIPDFGLKEIKSKIKSIRSTYAQELKKIMDSKRSGAGSDDIYKPCIKWFPSLDDVLRGAHLEIRKTHDNLIPSGPETDIEMLAEIPSQKESPPSHPRRKNSNKDLHSLLDKVKVVTNEIKEVNENEFQIFGRSVGVQLSALPLETALEAQGTIQSYITNLRLKQIRNKRPHSPIHNYCSTLSPPQKRNKIYDSQSPESATMQSPLFEDEISTYSILSQQQQQATSLQTSGDNYLDASQFVTIHTT